MRCKTTVNPWPLCLPPILHSTNSNQWKVKLIFMDCKQKSWAYLATFASRRNWSALISSNKLIARSRHKVWREECENETLLIRAALKHHLKQSSIRPLNHSRLISPPTNANMKTQKTYNSWNREQRLAPLVGWAKTAWISETVCFAHSTCQCRPYGSQITLQKKLAEKTDPNIAE